MHAYFLELKDFGNMEVIPIFPLPIFNKRYQDNNIELMYTSKITGLGHFVPENVVTNEDLSKLMDTNDAWIQERTGIKERRWIKEGSGETSSSMGAKAANIFSTEFTIDHTDTVNKKRFLQKYT